VSEPRWLDIEIVIAIHEEQLAEHGGGAGLRDRGLLESALERPRNKWSYENAPLAELAAAYAYGLARNHPFIDGNKRTALLALYTFLGLNGIEFDVPEPEAAAMILALAAGEIDEPALARWVGAGMKAKD
jgi:death on curing protein